MFHMVDQQKYQILFCLPNVVNCWGDKTFLRKSWYFIVTAQALYYKDEFVFFNRLWRLVRVIFSWRLFRPRFQKSGVHPSFWDEMFWGFSQRADGDSESYIIFIIPRVLQTNVSQKVQWWWLPSDAFGWAFKGDDMFPWGRLGLKSWCKYVKFVS